MEAPSQGRVTQNRAARLGEVQFGEVEHAQKEETSTTSAGEEKNYEHQGKRDFSRIEERDAQENERLKMEDPGLEGKVTRAAGRRCN